MNNMSGDNLNNSALNNSQSQGSPKNDNASVKNYIEFLKVSFGLKPLTEIANGFNFIN